MGAPVVYKYDDANAPVADGTRGSMIALLKACLVDGYGTKPAAGWTMPFVNAAGSKAAFRNDSVAGSGMFLQVDNAYGADNAVMVKPFETMSDEDTGTAPFFSSGSYYQYASSAASTVARPWIIIADSRIVLMFMYKGYTSPLGDINSAQLHSTVFGDGISLHSSDPYFCLFVSCHGTSYCSYLPNLSGFGAATYQHKFVARNVAGDVGGSGFAMHSGGGPVGIVMGQYGAPFGTGNPVMISRPIINDGVAYTVRGYIPGLWAPCHAVPYDNFAEVTIDGKTFIAITTYSYMTKAQILIDIGDTFRP